MRKIFLFLFAAVLSIGTAMAEVVTITGDDCALEYTVEDGHALIITGTYLEEHSFELTLISDEEIDLTAESFDCDMQMMKIGEFGSVAWADEGTATVTIYPAAIGITATGLFDSAGDDQNTYNLEDVLAFPKSSAGGDDIAVDNEFFVDMPSLTVTMDEILAFEATGQETNMGLGTVVTYLECDWWEEDGAYPVIPGASALNIPDMGLFGEVLAGSVVPVMDPSTFTVVSATATVYAVFEGMGTFKFTLNMTAGGSGSGEQEESNTVSVQVWNATLTQESGTLVVDGSMNGVAVHAEVPEFEFVPDTWDSFDYSDVSVEVGTWVEPEMGESDYVGGAYGDVTVELDKNTITITGKMPTSNGLTFDVYIQGSLQPADPMTSTTLTMEGMTKSETSRYIELADDNYNTIEIWGSGYSDYLKVTASLDVALEGYGSWNLVDGVETLVATLYDDYYTKVYHVTATASALQSFTLTSWDATYVEDPEFGEVTFRGTAEEGGEFEITVGNTVEGQFAAGYWGETEIVATEITDFEQDFFDNSYMLGGTFQDAEGNTYDVWVVAYAPVPDYTREVTSGNYGTICLPFGAASYTGMELYEFVGSETGKVYLASVTELVAGVPYIFQATATELAVYSDGTTAATPGRNKGLVGTFTDDTEVAIGNYILKDNAICKVAATCWVNAYRAYIVMSEVPSGAPTPMPGRKYINMSVNGENAETGVDNINGANDIVKMIENGQLIIVIDGVKYNAQGVRF
ncbi:MAG: hypothetical protein J6R26_07940 [Paludibacteraceae bacterium]|nr:hypothetical protein [Paludibacteraceae bacterium]